ncbi:MAG: winged helix-turn-helix transcriptional regulator [Spongiibacteraceae bacterium]|nr:winged helix-turn-helix transcriptional regulator [Spongiibacteraceae bacterium]
MFILKGILRAETQEKILIYLLVRDSGYGKAIAGFYGLSPNATQKQLARLEEDGVVISRLVGQLREFQLNPRYPFLQPLKALLKAALLAYPDTIKQELTMTRTRPRQAGKFTNLVR